MAVAVGASEVDACCDTDCCGAAAFTVVSSSSPDGCSATLVASLPGFSGASSPFVVGGGGVSGSVACVGTAFFIAPAAAVVALVLS